jgi:hypothetical protein
MRREHDEFLIFELPGGIFLKPIEKVKDPLLD